MPFEPVMPTITNTITNTNTTTVTSTAATATANFLQCNILTESKLHLHQAGIAACLSHFPYCLFRNNIFPSPLTHSHKQPHNCNTHRVLNSISLPQRAKRKLKEQPKPKVRKKLAKSEAQASQTMHFRHTCGIAVGKSGSRHTLATHSPV